MPNLWIGHKNQFDSLKTAVENNRAAHAYLLWGARGIGKNAFAVQAARAYLCENETFGICGECNSCLKTKKQAHPDLKILLPVKHQSGEVDQTDIKKQLNHLLTKPHLPTESSVNLNIGIEEVRKLRKEASLSPYESPMRIILILDMEKFSAGAANALLKLLEEPPATVRFIMTTNSFDGVLPTIRSRCQSLRFQGHSDESMRYLLNLYFPDYGAEETESLLQLAEGNFHDAVSFMGDNIEEEQEYVVEFLRNAHSGTPITINEAIRKLFGGKDKDQIRRFMKMLLQWFRDLLVLKNGKEGKQNIVFSKQKETMINYGQYYDKLDISEAVRIIEENALYFEQKVYVPLVITRMAIQLNRLLKNSSSKTTT